MNCLQKALTALAIIVIPAAYASADTDWPLLFDSLEYDFGEINEADGIVSHTFIFTNTSNEVVTIDNVSTSCGCTTASYPTEPIPPKQLCEFTVNFNPARTEGRVYRDIVVFVKGRHDCMGLVLMATVNPAPMGIRQMYPHVLAGNVRTNVNHTAFGYIGQGHSESKSIALVNDDDKPVTLKATISGNSGILSVDCPPGLDTQKSDNIILTYTLPADGKYGTMIDTVWIWRNGVKGDVPLVVNAIGTDDFTKQPAGRQPKLTTDPSYKDFGEQRAGKVIKQKFIIGNDGNADLIIRAVELSEGITADLKPKTVIKPGNSVEMTAATVVKGKPGYSYAGSVNLITNDPVRPRRELRMTIRTK